MKHGKEDTIIPEELELLAYRSLNSDFNALVNVILGKNYYTTAPHVCESNTECCRDIAYRFGKKYGKEYDRIKMKTN